MKNKYKFLTLLGLLPFLASAQLTNNGATIIVESGAVLLVEGSVTNTGNGVITNTGTIDIKGSLTNDVGSTITSNPTSKLRFSGNGAQTINSNGQTLVVQDLIIANTVSNVAITNTPVTVNAQLDFEAGAKNLNIGSNNLTMAATSSIDRTGSNGYIQADGSGKVIRNFANNATFAYAIGDDNEYSPITLTATQENATVAVNVEDAAAPDLPADVADYITRNWSITPSGFANFSATSVGTYLPGDVVGNSANVKGASVNALMEWSYAGAAGAANSVTGTVDEDVQFTGTNVYRRQPIKVFLAGPLSGSSMSKALNTQNFIPTTSPYDGSVSVLSTVISGANIVDWVKIELRSPGNSATILNTYSKFLLQNGSVVDLDGVTPASFRDAPADAFIAVRHRNHLGVMTATNLVLGSTSLLDFTLPSTATFGTNAQKTIGANRAMWSGDVNGNKLVSFFGFGNDFGSILGTLAGASSLPGYFNSDVNMNGLTSFFGFGNDAGAILGSLNGAASVAQQF